MMDLYVSSEKPISDDIAGFQALSFSDKPTRCKPINGGVDLSRVIPTPVRQVRNRKSFDIDFLLDDDFTYGCVGDVFSFKLDDDGRLFYFQALLDSVSALGLRVTFKVRGDFFSENK